MVELPVRIRARSLLPRNGCDALNLITKSSHRRCEKIPVGARNGVPLPHFSMGYIGRNRLLSNSSQFHTGPLQKSEGKLWMTPGLPEILGLGNGDLIRHPLKLRCKPKSSRSRATYSFIPAHCKPPPCHQECHNRPFLSVSALLTPKVYATCDDFSSCQ